MDDLFYKQLEAGIDVMTPNTRLYKLLKRKLKARGLWKPDKPRGKPFEAGDDPRRSPKRL